MPKKLKKINKRVEKLFKESDVGVLVENFNDNIKILAEGQADIRRDLAEFQGETKEGFRRVWDEFGSVRQEIEDNTVSLRQEMKNNTVSLKQEMKDNFKSVFEYLSRIEDEIMEIKGEIAKLKQGKSSKQDYLLLEKRVLDIEKQLEEYKIFFKLSSKRT